MYVWAEISVPPTCLTVSVQMIIALELHTKAIRIMIPVLIEIWMGHHTGASSNYIGATLPTVEPIMVFQGFRRSDIMLYQWHRVVLLILNLVVWDVKSRERRPCVASESHHSCHPSGRSSHRKSKIREFIVWGPYDMLQVTGWIKLYPYQHSVWIRALPKPLSVKQMGDSALKNLQNTSHQIQI